MQIYHLHKQIEKGTNPKASLNHIRATVSLCIYSVAISAIESHHKMDVVCRDGNQTVSYALTFQMDLRVPEEPRVAGTLSSDASQADAGGAQALMTCMAVQCYF